MEFHGTDPAITNADLDNLERQVGNKLPFAFRQHYLKYNGGWPIKDIYDGEHMLGQFYAIKHGIPGTMRSMEEIEAHAVEMGLFPKGVVPFSSVGADCYGIDTREPNYGAIYMSSWEGETYMEFVAPSFEVLMANLKEDFDEDDE